MIPSKTQQNKQKSYCFLQTGRRTARSCTIENKKPDNVGEAAFNVHKYMERYLKNKQTYRAQASREVSPPQVSSQLTFSTQVFLRLKTENMHFQKQLTKKQATFTTAFFAIM